MYGLVCVWLLAAASPAAHPVPFSYLDVRQTAQSIDAALVLHIIDVAHVVQVEQPERLLDPGVAKAHEAAIARLVEGRLRVSANQRPIAAPWGGLEVLTDRQSVRIRQHATLDAPAATLTVAGTLFPHDPEHKTFVNIYEGAALTQAVIDRHRPNVEYFAGTRQGAFAVVRKFVPSGVEHILIGPDHILFLVGLLLLGGSLKRLALIVTGFTVAHSVTLSLAALNLLNPPARVIEPAIALSIIYVGADNLLVRDGRDARAWIAFVFGLIHGFGFANVLREMHLPPRALGWSLASFNVGVEIGQLAVVFAVASVLAAVRTSHPRLARRLAVAGSVVIILAGAFWFVRRIVDPGGS
jgi:hydrogenase/urease accessory protein HupE